jgi:ribosomal protein S18 acetylase RimI-like enzyme
LVFRRENSTIRQASKQDSWSISRFLADASLVHKHLDWKETLEWIEDKPFLLHLQGNRLTGIFSCAADPPGVNWIHCFASNSSSGLHGLFSSFLNSLHHKTDDNISNLFTIGLQDWYCRLLNESGFSQKQKIVVLVFNGKVPAIISFSHPGIQTRPMEPADLKQVQLLDNLAFEPIWSFSECAIQHAFLQSEHASVAENGDQIIGYELSTVNHFSAHLARLAVHPSYQGKGIGSLLVSEMVNHFIQNGKPQITVNTQDDNSSSLALYQKMNFQVTGDSFPVFQKNIE